LILTPLISGIIARGGYSKRDVRKYLFENARIPASTADKLCIMRGKTVCEVVEKGMLPESFCETTDPNRMLPVVHCADEFLIVVSGDPMRNRSVVTFQPCTQGVATSKEIKLPPNWDHLMAERAK